MKDYNWWTTIKAIWDKEKNIDLQKRYYVFTYNQYYPGGGLEDVEATFDDVEEAIKFAENADDDYVDVFDKQLGAFIEIKK
jgi:hypothetical protein